MMNQPISLVYRFEGRGNAKLIEIPKFELPAGLELYDSKSEAKFFKDGRSFKEFRLLVIPRQAGTVTLPSWSVSLFDPEKKNYYTLSSEAMSLDVLQGQDLATVESRPMAQAGENSQPKAPVLPPLAIQSVVVSGYGFPAMAWAGLYALLSLGLVWQSRRELGWGRKRENLKRLVERRVGRLNELAKSKDFRKAGTSAINLIYFVLGELSGSGGGGQEITKLLESAPPSFRRQYQDTLTKLLRELEIIAFAPDAVVGALAEPNEIIKRLKQVQELLLKALQEEFASSIDGQDQ